MTRPTSLIIAALAAASLAGACSDSASTVKVVSTNAACKPEKTSFAAGSTTFEVVNKGGKVTELYVYGKGDKIVGEVEDVGPGTSRTLKVNLKKGQYELACKPGQTGSGIRQTIDVE
jgi:iron uptake system component EfeO